MKYISILVIMLFATLGDTDVRYEKKWGNRDERPRDNNQRGGGWQRRGW